jgi:hypothetical protein
MPSGYRYLSSLLLAAAFLAPAVTTGCATRTYRAYDPYYHDYHRWDNHETVMKLSTTISGSWKITTTTATFAD